MPVDLPLYKAEPSLSASKKPRTRKQILLGLALVGVLIVLYLNARINIPLHSEDDRNDLDQNIPPTLFHSSDPSSSLVPESKPQPSPAVPKPVSPHSHHHNALPHPFEDEQVTINPTSHYAQVVIIASEAEAIGRRGLIREKYFGLRHNMQPCMVYNADIYYKFWIHGTQPQADTPLRRSYESEKMEWNDIYESKKSFEQINILTWAEDVLAKQGITYDYLVVQDINTFMQLSIIKNELDTGVISENTESPFTLNTDAPTNMVWGTFGGEPRDKHAFVVGSAAVKLALDKQAEFITASNSTNILTAMYDFYSRFGGALEKAVDDSLEPEAAAEVQEQAIPEFVREDGPEDTQRFIRWENNIESVHAEDIVVTHVYQDTEFDALSYWTYLRPLLVCHPKATSDARTKEHKPLIALVTSSFIYDSCMEPSATLSALNKRAYCLEHGYSFVARSAEFAQQALRNDRKTVWGKIDAVEKVLPKYEWIFWMDMDAVVMNPNQTLETVLKDVRKRYPKGTSVFDSSVDLIVARPGHDPMINAGVFLMRNTPWAMQFLRDLQAMTKWYFTGPSYEQGAMWELLQRPEHADHVFLLDRDDHTFNTFPEFYQPGDFVVHFAPDRCPNDATLYGLDAAGKIRAGETILTLEKKQ
ncbi:galactosyl transferase GMA12/MNN10 family-domain-containing protein [Phycomyces nitens]|nr:galactosyl transferase GMA12/MNN10 family-domain-containing protein [Phycomyces nitens]